MFFDESQYIALLNYDEIIRKIAKFEKLDLSTEPEEVIRQAISDIFSVSFEGKQRYMFNSYLLSHSEGEYLYRIRKDVSFILTICIQDLWDNPNAPQNRFNRAGERVLYVSRDARTAMYETQIGVGECFVLIEYSIIQPLEISASEVKNRYGDEDITPKTLALINDFIMRQAKIKVDAVEKFKYKATNALADIINSFPPNVEIIRDGMQFVSTHTRGMDNLVIKGDRIHKLVLKNAWVARMCDNGEIGFYRQIFIENGNIRLGNIIKSSIEHIGKITFEILD
ncbi:MAG: RES family NAD+ phosphorylase [Clostridiaceae bacterium]